MHGERFIAGLMIAGSIYATAHGAHAATVTLPTTPTTLYLEGEIQNPIWVTFGLDAQIALQPTADPYDQISSYILNIKLATASDETVVQFAEIEGAAVENGVYGAEGPPRLLFSDSLRTLQIDPDPRFFNAILLSATLSATLPNGLFFRVEDSENAPEISGTPLPAAAPLFATGIGGFGFLAWRKLRKTKSRTHSS